jgi:rod shape-determining protein MreC
MVADHTHSYLRSVRPALSVLVYPLHFTANLPLTVSNWAAETFSSYGDLQERNSTLEMENLLLRVKLQKLDALERENMRLRDLLDSSFKVGDRVLISELVAVDLDPYKQQVLINKGQNSGIFEGQPVVDADAVIGQVTNVNPFTATVLMISDASHSIPVQVNRNGLRAIAMGTGKVNLLKIPHLPVNADIQVGDLLVTSGLGGRFPAGYPVAEVTSVIHEPGQSFASVEARPKAKLDRIREVLLVWSRVSSVEPVAPPEAQTGAPAEEQEGTRP